MTPTEHLRHKVWEWVDEHRPDTWDRPGQVDEAVVARCVTYANTNRLPGTTTHVGRARVRQWLTSPEEWSPHIDKVAVRRALAFDWDVIEALSRAEYQEVIRSLAAMRDPWEQGIGDFEYEIRNARTGGSWSAIPRTPRWRAWMRGTPEDRHRLVRAVSRRKAEVAA